MSISLIRAGLDVECDFCGETKLVASAPINETKAASRTHHRFTTADICLSCARQAVIVLEQAEDEAAAFDGR